MPKKVTEQLDMRSYQDGTTEIIYWDNKNGNDVNIKVDENGIITMKGKVISLKDFINKVCETSLADNNSAQF